MRRLLAELLLVVAITAHAAENGGGVITGSVRINGKIPAVRTISAEHDVDVCGDRARAAQSLMVGTNQCVRNAIVYLGAAIPAAAAQTAPVVLDQRDCEFVPRIQIARSGGTLLLKNSDSVLHVVRLDALSGTNQPSVFLNVATPFAGFEKSFPLAGFTEPTLLRAMNSNGHEWMAAYIAVLPHPWAALTDENGRFTIRGAPKGAYKLYAWHEVLGTIVRDVKVTGGQNTVMDLEFSTGR